MSLVKKLFIKKKKFELNIENWNLADSGITILWGASGSGKSTVLRCLLGLENKAQVEWQLGDIPMEKLSTPDRNIGVVFQSYDLFPHLTTKENIRFAAEARKLGHVESRSRLEHLVEKLDLRKCLDTRAEFLSGGERQRVALARALIANPRFLFLDEPFASLDVQLKSSARSLLKSVVQDQKIPVLMVTHDPQDVTELATKVAKLEAGKLIEK